MAIYYHYCSVDTFVKIISSKIFRLGSMFKMNDSTECQDFWSIVEQLYEKNHITKEQVDFINSIANAEKSSIPRYLGCFSTNSDLLSQWSMYGDDGKGVAVGIDLEKLISRIKEKYKIILLDYNNVIYNVEEKIKLIDDLLNKQDRYEELEQLRQSIQENDEGYLDFVSEYLEFDLNLLNTLFNYEILFKNESFQSESEVRIVYTHNLDRPIPNRLEQGFYVNGKSDIVSYCELPLDFDGCISKLIIGPKCPLTKESKDFRDFLKFNSLENIEVIKSKIPYI
ncbi:DUF2971 domain-containing protein [Turicibacter bilis]|uniref:DUF2971 domain-containing protein n=1 Tax=Turicibacter bilis TaxID=2735723 RepID=UPI0031BAEE71